MPKVFTPDDRRRLARLVGVNPATLYQALTAKGAGFAPAECVRIERQSNLELRRWDLRPNDWDLIWPELIDTEGAPRLPKGRRRNRSARPTKA
jgi:DNA-binding transcriptional regulator YdaS (Cro superfamily)